MKNRATLLNMISGFLLQLCNLISGFIIPKLILSYFGSEVNGLVASLNQFLSYIALVEGGISGVVVANLYKPLVDGDDEKISSIIVTSDRFYKKIGYIFAIYSFGLAIIYPIIFNVQHSFVYTFMLTLIMSINLLIQYMFSLTLRNLLSADKHIYIANNTQMIIVILNIILAIISVLIYPSIHILKLISGSLFVLQPLLFKYYAKHHYSINWKAKIDNSLIKERWNGFAINFAAFIHNSTDIAILTIFSDLNTVSIYSIYCLVSNGIKSLINACISGVSATVGQAYAKGDYDEVKNKLDVYEYIVFILVFFTFSVASLLITPFVQIYTRNISDANYYHPLFGTLLLISEALYLIKMPHMNLAYDANKFKEITIPSFLEAGLNIIISIILVNKWGLVGVTIGTIVGMIYRTIFHVYFTSKIVPGRKQFVFYKKLLVFTLTAVIGTVICHRFIPLDNLSVLHWMTFAVIYSMIIGSMYLGISLLLFKEELIYLVRYLKKEE